MVVLLCVRCQAGFQAFASQRGSRICVSLKLLQLARRKERLGRAVHYRAAQEEQWYQSTISGGRVHSS